MAGFVALITGVGSGVGKQLVNIFLEQGIIVIGLSRSDSPFKQVYPESKYHHVKYKIENLNDAVNSINKITQSIGKINYLINNAGYLIKKPAIQLSTLDLEASFRINSIFPFLLVQQLLEVKAFAFLAHVVNISSMGGVQASKKYPGLLAYSASKAALNIISESMHVEWGDRLIINTLALGTVNTPMFNSAFPDGKASISDVEAARWIVNFTVNSVNIMAGQIICLKKTDP